MTNTVKAGCAGGVLIHPLLFLIAFAKGTALGHPQPQVMSATSAYGAVEHGLAGGMNAMEDVLVHYVMTVGIAAVVVSCAGMGLACLLTWIVSRAKPTRR